MKNSEILAAIDLGANALRMTIAEVRNQDLHILEKLVHPLRIGKDTFIQGSISPETLEEALGILEGFKMKLEEYGITLYRAVATSAVREAENQEFFLEQIRLKTGIQIEIIERSEEERLIFSGLKRNVKDFKKMIGRGVMFAKVGSGNVEISLMKANHLLFSRSIPIGGLRLRENLKSVPEREFSNAMEKYIASDIRMFKQSLPKIEARYFIGAGTLLQKIHRLLKKTEPVILLEELQELYGQLKNHSIQQISEKYNLPLEYADLILPSAYTYLKFMELARCQELRVKNLSFTESLLQQKAGFFKDRYFTKKIWQSAVRIGEKYHFDKKHALQVSRLAVKIFDQLQEIHNLPRRYRFILKLASVWHDIGIFIQNSQHHKHSFYLISSFEMPGLSSHDTAMIATIARYHRKSLPKKYHPEYMRFSAQERVIISKLAALLRLADALDRSHMQMVKDLEITCSGHRISLKIFFKEEAWLEKIYIHQKKNLFTKVFGVDLEITEALI